MRHAIETAPKDGTFVILQDDASGTCDVAHWSPEAGKWVGKNSEPSKITPTHWHPMSRGKYLLQEDKGSSNPSQVGPSAWRRHYELFVDVIVAAAAIIGLLFYVTRDAGQPDSVRISTIGGQVVEQETRLPSQDSGKTGLLALGQHTEADQARGQAGAQVKQAVEASTPEARQFPDKAQRSEVLANELAEARRAIDGLNLKLLAEAAKTAQSLGQEREKTATLVQDAAAVRQELTASTVQHHRALEEERARGAALASELATARRETETQVALLRKAGDEAVPLKQAADSATTELRQSLQQEREKTATLVQD
ncbi:MAG TPA: hypothetical protein VK603_20875, partial [Candidatus Saccharimonadales bacterium]|nr:hypothetical protein [Candidatus Saccharimonadales bacterium]